MEGVFTTYGKPTGGAITFNAEAISVLLSVSRSFIFMLKESYPDVYKELLKALDEQEKRDPDFAVAKTLFITTLCM